jgi:hypothetical protein
VAAGTLSLQAEGGTPLGSGSVIVNSGGILTGVGRVLGAITVRPGGTIQPGTDAGKPLRVTNLSFPRTKDAARPTFAARLSSPGGRHLSYEGTGTLDLADAALKVTTTAGFRATKDTFVTLIDNTKAPAVRGTFQNLESGTRFVTADAKWTARISYQGDAKIGVPAGGKDVVLYDWAPVKK